MTRPEPIKHGYLMAIVWGAFTAFMIWRVFG